MHESNYSDLLLIEHIGLDSHKRDMGVWQCKQFGQLLSGKATDVADGYYINLSTTL